MCSDFLLQSSKMSKERNSRIKSLRLKANLIHSLIHFAVSLITTLPLLKWNSLPLALSLSATHFLIDYLKSLLIVKYAFEKYSILFYCFCP
jgi:hypothetical protein